MTPRTDRVDDAKVPDENSYMSAPIGSYASLGIPDFGRVFEFRWRMQRHHSPHTLASVVPLFILLFFIVLSIRGRPFGQLIAYSVAGASGVIVLVWIIMLFFPVLIGLPTGYQK